MNPTNPEQVCPTCGGDGFFAITSTERDCPTCHGTGKVAANPDIQKPESYTQNPSTQTGDTQNAAKTPVERDSDKTRPTGAAKPENRLGECAVHEDEHYKNDDCRGFQLFDADGNYARPAPVPVDQPDELDKILWRFMPHKHQTHPDGCQKRWDEQGAVVDLHAALRPYIAREREAAYKRGRDDEHWECDTRHISAALTKGETNG